MPTVLVLNPTLEANSVERKQLENQTGGKGLIAPEFQAPAESALVRD